MALTCKKIGMVAMRFSMTREALLTPLNLITGVVERRQTMAILANVLIIVEGNELSITGTDLEVELIGRMTLPQDAQANGSTTVSARKLATICKSLPAGCDIEFSLHEQQLIIRAGRSKFTLATLPFTDFPTIEANVDQQQAFTLPQVSLKRLIHHTSFAMAQQDVRYYLNGMLWEVSDGQLRLVAIDGHRLAMATLQAPLANQQARVILPYKGVMELVKLLTDDEEPVEIAIAQNYIQATTTSFTFTSKLVDGKFPDYQQVIPAHSSKQVIAPRQALHEALSRVAILANEQARGVRLLLANDCATITANNPEQEEAEEVVTIRYHGQSLEIGFNVNYLLDALSALEGEEIKISLADGDSSAVLEEVEDSDSLYVVMPMKL